MIKTIHAAVAGRAQYKVSGLYRSPAVGIHTVMITGDQSPTAYAIGKASQYWMAWSVA